jgi:superfamily I DNA/RNA helicase
MNTDVLSRKWLISEESFDEEQRKIRNLKQGNYLIEGCAGSGKTVLALTKAFEIKEAELGSYLVIIFTYTLRDFIKDGIKHLGLDEERICMFDKLDKLGVESADYIIVDEVQDFDETRIKKLVSMANKNFIFFGDDSQQLYSENIGDINLEKIVNISSIESNCHKKLNKNYRLPKPIAEFAQYISKDNSLKIVGQCVKQGGRKPLIFKCRNLNHELDLVQSIIEENGLLNVGILVQENQDVEAVKDYYENKNFEVEYKYYEKDKNNKKIWPPVNTLSFFEHAPKIITYHSSKGLQFDHVFLVDCTLDDSKYDYVDALYVAATRASEELYITYSNQLSPYIKCISSNYYDFKEIV